MINDAMIEALQIAVGGAGDDTRINRQSAAVPASWSRAEFTSVQRFVKEEHWAKAIYEVNLNSPAVFDAPYLLSHGSRLDNLATGDSGVVRGIDRETVNGKTTFVTVFVEILVGE